jgi:hypothetical protein
MVRNNLVIARDEAVAPSGHETAGYRHEHRALDKLSPVEIGTVLPCYLAGTLRRCELDQIGNVRRKV